MHLCLNSSHLASPFTIELLGRFVLRAAQQTHLWNWSKCVRRVGPFHFTLLLGNGFRINRCSERFVFLFLNYSTPKEVEAERSTRYNVRVTDPFKWGLILSVIVSGRRSLSATAEAVVGRLVLANAACGVMVWRLCCPPGAEISARMHSFVWSKLLARIDTSGLMGRSEPSQ